MRQIELQRFATDLRSDTINSVANKIARWF